MPERAARMPERRMAEAAIVLAETTVVHGPKSAVVESAAVKPATESTVAESTTVISATESAVEPAASRVRQRQPARDYQRCCRNPGTLCYAKRCLVHVILPCSERDSLCRITIGLVLWFRGGSEWFGNFYWEHAASALAVRAPAPWIDRSGIERRCECAALVNIRADRGTECAAFARVRAVSFTPIAIRWL